MCLAAPGIILTIDNSTEGLRMANVAFGEVKKSICIEWLPEAKVGDYILAHIGTALSILDEVEAKETLRIFDEWAEELEKNRTSSS